MSRIRQSLGQSGEKKAARYLKKKGFSIIQSNYRTPFGEIDIIAKDKDTLCFIEVKTRSPNTKGLPRQAVNPAKQQKIIHSAAAYLKENDLPDQRCRFDVMEVIVVEDRWQITLIPNAFQAS